MVVQKGFGEARERGECCTAGKLDKRGEGEVYFRL